MAVGAAGWLIIIKPPPTCCPRCYGKSKRETPFFSPSLAKQYREHYQKSPDRVGLVKKKGDRLTSREVEVLQLIAEDKANKETAAELGISVKTVEKHREKLMAKLDPRHRRSPPLRHQCGHHREQRPVDHRLAQHPVSRFSLAPGLITANPCFTGFGKKPPIGDIPDSEPLNSARAPPGLFFGQMIKQITIKKRNQEQERTTMNITQEPKHTLSEPTRLNRAASKKQISISVVLMAALLALLSSPSPGMAAPPKHGHGQAPVNLRSAGKFVILSESGISTTPGSLGNSAIVGNIGVSPLAATAITGFGLAMDASGQFSTSQLVVGKVYAADYAVPTPTTMTTAVSDMQTAYTDAAGRTLPNPTELGAGNISGLTIKPGLYKWAGVVTINDGARVTLKGGKNDVWIFQIGEGLTVGNGAQVILSGGAQAKNIFWQVGAQTTLGTTANFKGIILSGTAIVLNDGAVLTGRALAQTEVTLIANAVIQPKK